MPMQRVVERAVAAVTGRSVADLRRGLRRRARRLLRARRASGPLLSVVVPVYNVQDYLAEPAAVGAPGGGCAAGGPRRSDR